MDTVLLEFTFGKSHLYTHSTMNRILRIVGFAALPVPIVAFNVPYSASAPFSTLTTTNGFRHNQQRSLLDQHQWRERQSSRFLRQCKSITSLSSTVLREEDFFSDFPTTESLESQPETTTTTAKTTTSTTNKIKAAVAASRAQSVKSKDKPEEDQNDMHLQSFIAPKRTKPLGKFQSKINARSTRVIREFSLVSGKEEMLPQRKQPGRSKDTTFQGQFNKNLELFGIEQMLTEKPLEAKKTGRPSGKETSNESVEQYIKSICNHDLLTKNEELVLGREIQKLVKYEQIREDLEVELLR